MQGFAIHNTYQVHTYGDNRCVSFLLNKGHKQVCVSCWADKPPHNKMSPFIIEEEDAKIEYTEKGLMLLYTSCVQFF